MRRGVDGSWAVGTYYARIGFASSETRGAGDGLSLAYIDAYVENTSGGETDLVFGTGLGGVPIERWKLTQPGHCNPVGGGLSPVGG